MNEDQLEVAYARTHLLIKFVAWFLYRHNKGEIRSQWTVAVANNLYQSVMQTPWSAENWHAEDFTLFEELKV